MPASVEGIEEEGEIGREATRHDDVLFDLLWLRPKLHIPTDIPLRKFAARLGKAGLVKPARGLEPKATRINLDVCQKVVGLMYNGTIEVGGRLALATVPGGIRIMDSSVLKLNAMRSLRTQIDAPPAAGPSGDNYIGPVGKDWPELQAIQLENIVAAVDSVLDVLQKAAESNAQATGHIRILRCEICRDRFSKDAPRLARDFADLADCGGVRKMRVYGELEAERNGNFVTVSWHGGSKRGKIMRKVYPKSDTVLRTEIGLMDPKSVAGLLGGPKAGPEAADAALDGRSVAALLEKIAGKSRPLLDYLWQKLDAVASPKAGTDAVFFGLAPLLGLCFGLTSSGIRGRKTGPKGVALAREAVTLLLDIGRFDATGTELKSSVRKALKAMCEPGGILEQPELGRAQFVVRPEFMPAARALAGVLWPRDPQSMPTKETSKEK